MPSLKIHRLFFQSPLLLPVSRGGATVAARRRTGCGRTRETNQAPAGCGRRPIDPGRAPCEQIHQTVKPCGPVVKRLKISAFERPKFSEASPPIGHRLSTKRERRMLMTAASGARTNSQFPMRKNCGENQSTTNAAQEQDDVPIIGHALGLHAPLSGCSGS